MNLTPIFYPTSSFFTPIILVFIKILVYNNYSMNPISQIKLEREDKRIKLTLPYNPTHIKKIKTISDYRWHPDKKHWSFPYSEDIFKKILSLFDGENIHLDSTLQRLAEETGKNEDFQVLRRELIFGKYSPKTVKAYLYYNRDMLKLTNKSPFNVKDSDIKDISEVLLRI